MTAAISFTTVRCTVPKLPLHEEPPPPPLRLVEGGLLEFCELETPENDALARQLWETLPPFPEPVAAPLRPPVAILAPAGPPTLADVKVFVLRRPDGGLLDDADDLVAANTRARMLRQRVTVYKRQTDGSEVAMSHAGPGGWNGGGRRPATQVWRGPY